MSEKLGLRAKCGLLGSGLLAASAWQTAAAQAADETLTTEPVGTSPALAATVGPGRSGDVSAASSSACTSPKSVE